MKVLPCGSDVDNAGHHTGAKTNLKTEKEVLVNICLIRFVEIVD
jgi:hypothetical protein